MKISLLLGGLAASAFFLVATAHAASPFVYVIKASGCPGLDNSKERVQSGFQMKGTRGILTALHGVYACSNVIAYVVGKPTVSVEVDAMDVDRDVALLQPRGGGSVGEGGLSVGKANARAVVVGHPLDLSSRQLESRISLREAKPINLEYLVPSGEHAEFNLRGSPILKAEVFSLEGAVTAGHSGAPVLNPAGEVFAIANGGLAYGASEIAWGIPISDLQLRKGSIAPADRKLTERSQLLFSVTAPRGGAPKSTLCFGRPLVYIRSIGIQALVDSVDDKLTLSQISFVLQADELDGVMDIYRTSDFLVSVVVPRGWSLKDVDKETCVANAPSGHGVAIGYSLMALPPASGGAVERANAVVIPWERKAFCGDQYVADPSFSNHSPRYNLRRGVVSLRKSYIRIDFRCGHPGLGYDIRGLMSQWKQLPPPLYGPIGSQQCTVLCPMGLMLFPTAIAAAASAEPEFFSGLATGNGFASMLASANDVLVSSVRLDGRHNSEINACLFRMSSSPDCRKAYAKQTDWARAVIGAAASQLTPAWD